MKYLKAFDHPLARSTVFIVFVGGLFSLISYIICHCSGSSLLASLNIPCINFLESAGIMSFAYIIFFGAKYGFSHSDTKKISDKSRGAILSDSCVHNVNRMSATEKDNLKSTLENYIILEKRK